MGDRETRKAKKKSRQSETKRDERFPWWSNMKELIKSLINFIKLFEISFSGSWAHPIEPTDFSLTLSLCYLVIHWIWHSNIRKWTNQTIIHLFMVHTFESRVTFRCCWREMFKFPMPLHNPYISIQLAGSHAMNIWVSEGESGSQRQEFRKKSMDYLIAYLYHLQMANGLCSKVFC